MKRYVYMRMMICISTYLWQKVGRLRTDVAVRYWVVVRFLNVLRLMGYTPTSEARKWLRAARILS